MFHIPSVYIPMKSPAKPWNINIPSKSERGGHWDSFKSNLFSRNIFYPVRPRLYVNEIYQLLIHIACMSERYVLKIRKTLEWFYIKEADWNLSRFHICSFWPEVFWLGKIFLFPSPFSKCPTKTCTRMGNIFWVPKESSICLKETVEPSVERSH